MINWSEVFGLWYDIAFVEMERAVRSCPDALYEADLWDVTADPASPPMPVGPDGNEHPSGLRVLSAFWKVAFHGLAANEWNLSGRPSGYQLASPFSAIRAGVSALDPRTGTAREMLPVPPPSKDDLLAYLEHNKTLVHARLDAARDLGDGTSTLGPWSGPTDTLLGMFHGNICHLVSHETELQMFLRQHR